MSDSNEKINILYLHTHDTGRYIGAYGYSSFTPNIDSYAEGAVTFRNAFCVSPTCSPSRAGLLTGVYPHELGMLGLAHLGFSLKDNSRHLATLLKQNGYITALCGVQHISDNKQSIGYDTILDSEEDYFNQNIKNLDSYDIENALRASDFILKENEKPFFLSFGLLNTHRPFPKNHLDVTKPVRPLPPIPDVSETRSDSASFYTALSTADRCVGEVIDALKESGKYDNTLIVLTTDHGPAFPNMKSTLYDTGTGVFLIIKPPYLNFHQSIDAMVSQLDILPTICDYSKIEPPIGTRGKSLVSLINGTSEKLHDYLFCERTFHCAYEPSRSIRSERYKLIRNFSSYKKRVPVNVDDSPSKELFNSCGFFSEKVDDIELYDLILDPGEKMNKAYDSSFKTIKDDLSSRLLKWMKETDDPLLHGEIKAPENARVRPPDTYSP
jgi:N-sulfoglucosamine sulfohydrolase